MLAQQLLGVVAVDLQTIALAIRTIRTAAGLGSDVWTFIPIQTQPLQVFKQLCFVAGLAAFYIGIFNAQDHGPALLPGKEPVKQRSAHIAYMQLAGGGRSKSD